MLISLFNWFTKITAWPVQKICFRTKIKYEDRSVQGRRIKGPAILVSNHTSVFDYAVYLFVFWGRTLRFQMAEVLFERKVLGLFLKMMGGILIHRDSANLSFLSKSSDILANGGIVGIFPEGRLARKGEERPLPFKTGAAFLSLQTGVPIIPVYTNGSYFSKKRASVVIGKPCFPSEIEKADISDREKIEMFSGLLRERIINLGKEYGE